MPHFAAALVRTADGWKGEELELDAVEDLDGVADALRDLLPDDEGTALMFLEENDEYFLVARVDGDSDEPRVFLSDVRAIETSELAARLFDETATEPILDDEPPGDDESDGGAPAEGAPGGDEAILADFGTRAAQLRELCAEEGMLPADVIYALCERAGCVDVLEELRGAA